MRVGGILVLGMALVAAGGCSHVEPIRGCEPRGAARPVCGFQNPEDLVVVPGTHLLIVSEYGALDGTRPGRLVLFDLATDARTVLYAGGGDAPADRWGDPSCPGPPTAAFSPHGIDLAPRRDGRLALYVVNHGGRESVELFEVLTGDGVALAWRGCATAPPESSLNDVAGLPDDGFMTTHMFERSSGRLRLAFAYLFGRDTGYVLEWHPASGFSKVAGSAGAFDNGIAIARDGASIYVNATLGNTVRRIDRATGRELARAEVRGPDNLNWADGRLLVASIRAAPQDITACDGLNGGACPLPFAIVGLDPETLAQRELYAGEGPPMGAGTAAVEVDGELVIGSFAGDRVLRVRLPSAQN